MNAERSIGDGTAAIGKVRAKAVGAPEIGGNGLVSGLLPRRRIVFYAPGPAKPR
jgi:hypothetical protein